MVVPGYIISYSYGNRLQAFSDNSLKISKGLNNLKYILIRHKPVTYSLMVITIRNCRHKQLSLTCHKEVSTRMVEGFWISIKQLMMEWQQHQLDDV